MLCCEAPAAAVVWSKLAGWPLEEDHGWCVGIFLLGALYHPLESGQRASCRQQAWSRWGSGADRPQPSGTHAGVHLKSRERDKEHCKDSEMMKRKRVVFMQPCAEVVEEQEREQGKWTLLRNVNQVLKPTTMLAVRQGGGRL